MSMRKFRTIALAVAMLGLLVGSWTVQAQEQVVVTVLDYFDATSPGAARENEEIWAEFERRNPDIRVERETLYLEPFHQQTAAYVAAGQLPDVLLMWPGGRSAHLHEQRLTKDLTPFVEPIRHLFYESALQPQAAGYLAMLPQGLTASHVMFVNTRILNELGLSVPETYEDLVAMIPTLRAAGYQQPVIMGAQDDWVIQSTFFSMILGRLAGDEFTEAVARREAKFTDEPFLRALRFYAGLFDDGVLSPLIVATSYGDVNALFAQGVAPFMIDGEWKVGNFITDPTTGEALIPPSLQEDIEITVFPAIPGEIVSNTTSSVVSTGYGMNAAIPAGSAKEQAAWRLIEWLLGPEAQKVRLESGGNCCSRVDVEVGELEPLAEKRMTIHERFLGTHVFDNVFPPAVNSVMNVVLQEMALGLKTPEQAAAEVQEAWDRVED